MLRNILLLNTTSNNYNNIIKRTLFSCSNNNHATYDTHDTHSRDNNGKLVFGGSIGSTKHLNYWDWPEMANYEVSYVTYEKVLELEKSLSDTNKKLNNIIETLEEINYKL